MHLTSEQRIIGKQNFSAAIGSDLVPRSADESLRDFLKKCNAEGLKSGAGLGAAYFGYGTVERPVRVAVLGTGDEGNVLIGAINPKYVKVVAIADIRPFNQHRAFHGDVESESAMAVRKGLMHIYGWQTEEEARRNVRVYDDFMDLLKKESENTDEDTKVEAVIIGLPLFLHAPAAIEAMKCGYHVLTEKLMGHTIADCKDMARAAEKLKKHLATGHQRHYNILYDHAKKLIESGVLGDLHYIRAQWHRNNKPGADSWQPPLPDGIKKESDGLGSIEKDRDSLNKKMIGFKRLTPAQQRAKKDEIELTQKKLAQKEAQLKDEVLLKGGEVQGFTFKSADEYGYKTEKFGGTYDRPAAEELIRWRLYDRTSAGLMAELGSHQLDAASIFIASMYGGKKQYPLAVSATSARSLFPGNLAQPVDRDAEDHIQCVFDYAAEGFNKEDALGKQRKITVAYASINGNGFGGYGETVFGTKGTLLIETEKEALLYRGAEVEQKTIVAKKRPGRRDEYLDLDLSPNGDLYSEAIGVQALFGDISRGYCEQIEHWAYCIRENPEAEEGKPNPRCTPAVALADAVIALTTNIAAAKGETVNFKSEWFDVNADDTPEVDLGKNPNAKPDLAKYGV